jgi:cyclopropane fatty-acyl-phospholipid synthase-like methyltransferase
MNWKAYWTSYPKRFGKTEYLRQVKNTVGGQPVPDSTIRESIATICSHLELESDDTLLDLCCGNGLITREFSKKCRSVVGVDFSKPLIEIASMAHCASNISYLRMNVLDFSGSHHTPPGKFPKIVMIAGLQYFKATEFPLLMRVISDNLSNSGIVLLTAVPDRKHRAAFYSTARRRLRQVWERMVGRDQMGTWWDTTTIERVCQDYDLDCRFMSAGQVGLHYRFDVKITRKKALA